jgi:polyhydroxyalkanoate synthesis repressor PhaR
VTRTVRRYPNRKLYDTQARRYVTLDGLRRLVASGHEVEVVDQATGEDITSVTLAHMILEGVREQTARIPRQVLAAIVRLGASTAAAASDSAAGRAARQASHDAERIARRVVDHLSLDEAVALRQEIAEAVQRGVRDAQHAAQSKLNELVRQLERQAAGHPVLATVGTWLAGWAGEETRRTSWRRPGRQPPPAGRRARAERGGPGRTPASGRSPRSARAGKPRSAPSRRRKVSSGASSAR